MALKELDKVKKQIMDLSRKTVESGCSEAEALSAMALVGKLLERYHLSMEECDVRDEPCGEVTFNTKQAVTHPIDRVAVAMANYLGTKVWHSTIVEMRYNTFHFRETLSKSRILHFFGKKMDVELADYLMKVIWNAFATETKTFQTMPSWLNAKGGKRKAATVSFLHGMGARLTVRFLKMKKDEDAARPTGQSLIVLKNALVEAEFEKLGMKLHKVPTSRVISNNDAYHYGVQAADKVNLSRPIGNNNVKGFLGDC